MLHIGMQFYFVVSVKAVGLIMDTIKIKGRSGNQLHCRRPHMATIDK